MFLSKRLTRCFRTIAIVKQFMNDFISYSFSIVITTSTLFFILIFFYFDFSFNISRNFNHFFKKFIFNFDTFCFKNIKQFLVLDFNEIELSFHYFRFLFKLNQKILKSLYFRVNDVRLIIYNMINRNNYIVNATLLLDFFTYASDTINVFNQRIHESIVIIIFFNNRKHFIVCAHNSTFNYIKSLRNLNFYQFVFAQ